MTTAADPTDALDGLSPAEIRCLRLSLLPWQNRVSLVAAVLHCSSRQVKTYRARIRAHFHAESFIEALKQADCEGVSAETSPVGKTYGAQPDSPTN